MFFQKNAKYPRCFRFEDIFRGSRASFMNKHPAYVIDWQNVNLRNQYNLLNNSILCNYVSLTAVGAATVCRQWRHRRRQSLWKMYK